jgi:hypothetical protein
MSCGLDRRYLKTFTHLSTRLFSYFDREFTRYIVQTASSGCTSQYALLALSTQLELFAQQAERRSNEMAPATLAYSLHQYGKAIQSLHQQLAVDPHDSSASIDILVTAILLISYEILRGHDIAALIHLEGALAGLNSIRPRATRSGSPALGYLTNIFMRLDLQSLSYLGDRVPSTAEPLVDWTLQPSPCLLPARNQDLVLQLRDSLLNFRYRAFQFLRIKLTSLKAPIPTDETIPTLPGGRNKYEERERLLEDLSEWRRAFDQVPLDDTGGDGNCLPSNVHNECRVLYVLYFLELIRLSTCFEEETSYDRFAPEFAQIIALSSAVISAQDSARCQLFTLEMGLIDPLYWTGLKCRNPFMRRQAAQLLRSCGREGIWDGAIMACVANHVINVEENLAAGGRVRGVELQVNRNEASLWVMCYVPASPSRLKDQDLDSQRQWQKQGAKIFYGEIDCL